MDSAPALAALDELPQATLLLRPSEHGAGLVVDYANRAAEALAGVARGALLGRPPVGLSEWLSAGLNGVLRGGAPLRTQLEPGDLSAAAGAATVPAILSASRLGDGLLVVCEPVEAPSNEHRYRAVLDATSDWVSIADADEKLVYVNAGGRRMVGIGLDEDLTGTRIGEFSPAWARERVLGEALEVARREGVWRGDMARLHRDGHEIPISQVIVARTDDDGEVDFYATIARDMTAERAAERALRDSEERFRIAFEQAPIGVSLIDLDGRFVQVNDAYCATVRRAREDLLRMGPVEITHPDDVASTRHALTLLATGALPVFRFEKRYVDAAGEAIWVEVSGSLFRDAGGNPQYVISMVQDLGERRIAHTLQRSMLTTRLPRIEGAELAVRYLPGTRDTEVGGDWYDVIPLPDGRTGIAIGDVVGRGIEAAATMSQLRTALRAYAVEGLDPAVVVAKLHRLVDHLRVGMGTTLVYLDFDPRTLEVRYVSAGHLPVLHVAAGGTSSFLSDARSTPLGTAPAGAEIGQASLTLAAGDAVLLYTDGLVERRDAGIDVRLEQLRAAVKSAPAGLRETLEHLTATLGEDAALRHDDVALLALRVGEAEPKAFSAAIGPVAEQLGALRADLRVWLTDAGATARETGDVLIAVGEACANAIEHAGAPADSAIDVRGQLVGRDVVVRVRDRGCWQSSDSPPDRGRGLLLMRLLMDEIDIASGRDGTSVELRRRLAVPSEDLAPAPAAVAPGGRARLTCSRERDVPVAALLGDVDLADVGWLGPELARATLDGDRGLVLDLGGVEYLDSAGTHLLYDVARRLRARGQALRLVAGADAAILRALDLLGIRQSVPLDATVAEAVRALAHPRALD